MDELSTIKMDLRGVLISCPQGMTIGKLSRDYVELVGKQIPFTKMGFNKLEDFLRSLKDTLVVSVLLNLVIVLTQFVYSFTELDHFLVFLE